MVKAAERRERKSGVNNSGILNHVAEVAEEFERTNSGRLIKLRKEDLSFNDEPNNMLLVEEMDDELQ